MKNNPFTISRVITVLIILYPVLFIWQGLDFADTGLALTNYQWTFSDPESVNYGFFNWLTNIIGGVWVLLFGDSLGVLGVKLAGVLIVYLTAGLSYFLLKPYIDRKYLLMGLFSTLVFTNYSLIHQNVLTAIFYVTAMLFLVKGLKSARNWQILFSGLILGLNIFIRFPNILGFLLILSVFFYGYINKATITLQIKQAISFVSGYLFAILLTIFAMTILGHYGRFINSLNELINMASDPKGHHGIVNLVSSYTHLYITVITYLCLGLLIVLVIYKLFSLFKSPYLHYAFLTIITIFIASQYTKFGFLPSIFAFPYNEAYNLFLGTSYVILLLSIFGVDKSNKQLRLISFVAILTMAIIPLGSNNGIQNSIYGFWIPIPIVVAYIFKLKEIMTNINVKNDLYSTNLGVGFNSSDIKSFRNFAVILFVLFVLYNTFTCSYNDSKNRIKMRYPIENSRLIGIFTTKERAEVVQELLNEINKYVKEGDYLLTYNNTPILYFLTKTKPYLYNAWIDLYSPDQLRQAIEKADKENPNLPFVVRSKFNTMNSYWPQYKSSERDSENRTIMEDFIKRNKYSLLWQNDFFEILASPDRKLAQYTTP